MPTATKFFGKLAAVALLFACAAVSFTFVALPPFHRLVQLRESVTTQRGVLGYLQASLLEAKPAGDSKRSADKFRSLFLTGESSAVMAAQLHAVLRATAEAQGWRLMSTQPLPVRLQSTVQLIGVEARLTTSWVGLQRILLDLEAARPLVMVTALQIAPLAATPSDPTIEEQLTVRLEIFGASAIGQPEATDVSPRR